MYHAIEFSSADDTNLLLIKSFLKKMNEHINKDLKLTIDWIRANKLSLNACKTEIVIFMLEVKPLLSISIFVWCGQKIEPSCQVCYVGVILQDDLHWNTHLISHVKNWVVALIYCQKWGIMHQNIYLRTIYWVFNSH